MSYYLDGTHADDVQDLKVEDDHLVVPVTYVGVHESDYGDVKIPLINILKLKEVHGPRPDGPLHPTGRCRCAGEGSCWWCVWTEERVKVDEIQKALLSMCERWERPEYRARHGCARELRRLLNSGVFKT